MGILIMMPREKLLKFGAQSLSDYELLAIFLRTGIKGTPVLNLSQELLCEFGSLYQMMNASHMTFCKKKGLGTTKYTQLQAVLELSKRYLKFKMTESSILTSPNLTHHYLASQFVNKDREVFLVIFLNNQNQVICNEEMFLGTYNCVEVHPREIVRKALSCNASAIILAHNHPSGFSEPSQADRDVTEQIEAACNLVDIRILDHFIIGKGEYVSFAERGWL